MMVEHRSTILWFLPAFAANENKERPDAAATGTMQESLVDMKQQIKILCKDAWWATTAEEPNKMAPKRCGCFFYDWQSNVLKDFQNTQEKSCMHTSASAWLLPPPPPCPSPPQGRQSPNPPLGEHTTTVHAHLQAQKLQHKTKEFSIRYVQRAANVRRPTP